MVKIFFIMINYVNIFTLYESILLNVITSLSTIYQNKTKGPGKIREFQV